MFFDNHVWRLAKRCMLIVIGLSLLACQNGEGKEKLSKGADKTMKTYPMGRFSIDVPVEMKIAYQEYSVRYADIEEFIWPKNVNKEKARTDVWDTRVAEINKLQPPKGKDKIIIVKNDLSDKDRWSRGIFYYGDRLLKEEIYFDVLVDYGQIGVWYKIHGISREAMIQNLANLVASYSHRNIDGDMMPSLNLFYTKYGAVNLPYLEQEHTYFRFEGHPLDLMLQIRMDETYEVEKTSLVDSMAKFLISNVTPGLEVTKVRSQKRKLAGLKGEEIVLRMKEDGESDLKFRWQYQGKEDSGEHPEIDITMESPDGNLDAKLKVWDAILDSMKPMFERKK